MTAHRLIVVLVAAAMALGGFTAGVLANGEVIEQRTLNCTRWCQRAAHWESGSIEDGECTCWGGHLRPLCEVVVNGPDTGQGDWDEHIGGAR